MTNKIWFVEPNELHNNFGIMAEGNAGFISAVDSIARRDFTCPFINDPDYEEKKSWGAFHQGSDRDWTYWEFWHEMTNQFREKVKAKILDIQCELKMELGGA